MLQALELASRAQGRTCPNPMMGAVVVKDGQVIGTGYHRKAGTPHAEIHALAEAGDQARGATLYVTLEPCSHFGRTPPCADAVIEAGIAQVFIATLDPNPQVAGAGWRKLSAAGLEVEVGLLEQKARRLNQVFWKYIQTGRPLVALKTAMTLDGKIASYSGDSKWVTGESARLQVHQLRNIYDGILAGIGTVLKDNPRLNTRLAGGENRDPVRIIIDGRLQLPLTGNIARTAERQRTLVFCSNQADPRTQLKLERMGLHVIRMDCPSDLVPLETVLDILGRMEICSLLVEGGGEINGYLLEHDLVDKVYWFIAPKIIGGRDAPSPVGGQGRVLMQEALELKSVEMQSFGADILITGYIKEW